MHEFEEGPSPPSSSRPDSESPTSKELPATLDKCLSNIQSNGSFALFGHLQIPTNPGLYLKDSAEIGLPLTERDAQLIVAASHAAPFGKGEQIIVGEKARKMWEFSPRDFDITNSAWKAFLDSIVAKLSAGLGANATCDSVSAELYKMLLYDKGLMFKQHQE
jgi:hypothetical protein